MALKPNDSRCPHCLEGLNRTASHCPNPDCGEELPSGFFDACRAAPQAWLMPVGLAGHGKTALRKGLLLAAERLSDILPDAEAHLLDEATRSAHLCVREEHAGRKAGQCGDWLERPWLVRLAHKLTFGNRTLVVADAPAMLLEDPATACPALAVADPLMLVISLAGLGRQQKYRLDDLLGAYLTLLERNKAPQKRRTLLVVYTMGDKHDFGPAIDAYLSDDPFVRPPVGGALDVAAYLGKMKEISRELEAYTRTLERGSTFITRASTQKLDVRFCVTAPHDGRSLIPGKRVLDALMWMLHAEVESQTASLEPAPALASGRFLLILDAAESSCPVYADSLPQAFWEALRPHGTIETFYLGKSATVRHRGQRPPTERGRNPLPRLIGPILDRPDVSGSDCRVVVLTNGVPQDLADFNLVKWHRRLLLVGTSPDLDGVWPRLFIFGEGDEAEAAVNFLIEQDTI